MSSVSRNSPCPCGSGKKFKHCCGADPAKPHRRSSPGVEFRRIVSTALERHQSGSLGAALELYDQALRLQPDDSGILGLKGMALSANGETAEAAKLIDVALAANPGDARLHNYRGLVFVEEKNSTDAEFAFVAAVRLNPAFAEAWFNLGKLLLARKSADAVAALENAVRTAPADPVAHLKLGIALFYARRLEEARGMLRRALELGAAPATTRLWQGLLALSPETRIDDAEKADVEFLSQPAVGDDDEVYTTLLDLAEAEVHVGHPAHAERLLAKAAAMKPDVPGPFFRLAGARKFTDQDRPLVAKMEKMFLVADEQSRRAGGFALGKIYNDLRDYDAAFSHYRVANDTVRGTVPFDPDRHIAAVSSVIEKFSAEQLRRLPRGSESNVPIVIVGTPRSGTTLTEQVISSHSQVAGAGEMVFWSRVVRHVMDGFPASFDEALAMRLANEYLMFMRQHSATASRITDKMPGNFTHLGLIHAVFPNAKIVHCRRHPIDACLSIYFQNFVDGHAYKWDLESLAVFYEQYVRLMEHWRTVLPAGTMFELKYEDMVDDLEGVSRRLMHFLGLAWDDEILKFYKQDRAVYTASRWQVRQPVYKTSKERWRNYEKDLGPLLGLLKYV